MELREKKKKRNFLSSFSVKRREEEEWKNDLEIHKTVFTTLLA